MLRSTVGKTVVRLTLATTAFYAGGVALSLKNDAVNEIFTDKVPFAEDLVDSIQDLQFKQKEFTVGSFKEKFGEFEKTVEVPKSGVISEKIDSVKEILKTEAAKAKAAITQSSTPKESVKVVTKQVVRLAPIEVQVADPDLQKVITEFNTLINQINHGELTQDVNLQGFVKTFQQIDTNIKNLENAKKVEIQKKLDELVTIKEKQALDQYSKEFTETISRIETQHQQKLADEIKTTKIALDSHYLNIVRQNQINTTNEFTKLVKLAVEEEREGKYSRFNELNAKLEALQNLVLKIDSHLSNHELRSSLQLNLSKLKSKLDSNKIEDLKPEIEALKKIAADSKNEVLTSSINAIGQDVVNQGLLTNSQLITRFQLLAPELKSAALLPPNAGVLGHLSSKLFSTFLLSKKGHSEGSDIESVIARVEDYLITNQLDNAVEEVANLKGWSRKLADDWLVESRKRLEVEFLVNVIDLESRTLY